MTITTYTLKKNNITDFARERNELLKKAKTDWVLFLDSDEHLLKPLQDPSENYDKPSLPLHDGYFLKRRNYFLGDYVGTDKIVRLGKKNKGKWKRMVHEVWDIKNVGVLDNEIIHNTADNISIYLDKINNYSTLHAIANMKEGKRSTLLKIIFFPLGKFILSLIKSKHVVFSIMQSLHSFLSWTKLYFLQH
jgi:hypothetical protein